MLFMYLLRDRYNEKEQPDLVEETTRIKRTHVVYSLV